jgi:predicted tellurium resistance membrane protein TerC
MEHLFTGDNLVTLITLTILEIVLGIDNVIFVSILMGKLESAQKKAARRAWMIAGIGVRVALLMAMGWIVNNSSNTLIPIPESWASGHTGDHGGHAPGFNLKNIIMLFGGLFLLYKTVKEIHAKLEGDEIDESKMGSKAPSVLGAVIGQIILIDTIFSFDSIITAIGLAKDPQKQLPVMIIAVIIAVIIMFFFANKISDFVHKHPTLKMLALAFLLLVGFNLFFEGMHPLHGKEIPKAYVYFAMAFSVGVELLNMRMRKKNKPIELREPYMSDEEQQKG